MTIRSTLLALSLVTAGAPAPDSDSGAAASARAVLAHLDTIFPALDNFYIELHRTPELSLHEEATARKLAAVLREEGFEVATGIGGHGLFGVLRNGAGPTVMLRTDLDGLPVEEKTGLEYASTVKVKKESGETVPVMHACGHDVHMTSWIGAATLLARSRDLWKGTLVMVGQPAEEVGTGARAMLGEGLFSGERFPKPDFAFAIHDSADLPAGTVAYSTGYSLASADSIDLVVHGKGGHGAYPHKTVDPILLASRIVVSLQAIVARERNPLDPAVVTVGSFHAGTKHNIVPDSARLQLTVRAYKKEVRDATIAAIERIAKGEALAAGAPKEPEISVVESTPSTYNDPAVAARVAQALSAALGAERVTTTPPVMGAEDFSEYSIAGVPSASFWVGAVEPGEHAAALKNGEPLPSLHSPLFAPDRVPTLRTGVSVMTVAALELLRRP